LEKIKGYVPIKNIDEIEFKRESLEAFEIRQLPLIPISFQAGYLTISGYNEIENRYKLNYPNKETEMYIKNYILSGLAYATTKGANAVGYRMSARSERVEGFKRLRMMKYLSILLIYFSTIQIMASPVKVFFPIKPMKVFQGLKSNSKKSRQATNKKTNKSLVAMSFTNKVQQNKKNKLESRVSQSPFSINI
jgi:hypothetical protein